MKLGVLTSSISRNAGGLYTSVRKLTQAVQRLEVESNIYSFKDEFTVFDQPNWLPLKTEVFDPKGPSFFPFSKEMSLSVLKSNSDLLHCHGIWLFPSFINVLAYYKFKTPYVISPRGMLDPWAIKNSAWKKKLVGILIEDRHLKNATCLHALCASEAESIRAYGLTNPIAIIPNGIDLPSLEISTAKSQSDVVPKSVEKTKQHSKKLLFLGRIHPKKGLKELIDGWDKIINESSEQMTWELIIAGWDDGGHEAGLKQQVTSLGLEDSISFVGSMFGEAKDQLLRKVDAFILPSFSEGLPMSVLEAWAYQLPVLMTDFCNIPEGFDAKAAIHIEPTPASIAAGLQELINLHESDLKKTGQRGRRLVEDKFTWDSIAVQMKDVYAWCVTRDNPPICMRFD